MTYIKTSQKEMAETIKGRPRKKINCLTYSFQVARLTKKDVPFFESFMKLLLHEFEGLFFILKDSRDKIKEMHFSTHKRMQ